MSKLSFMMMFFFLLTFFFFIFFHNNFGLFIKYFYPSNDFFVNLKFIFILDYSSLFFVFMVTLVTSLVLFYSEVYMEHCNNKKFLFIMIMFFFSMFILSTSGNSLNLMLGWDGLGLTSIFLIMFYPNKMTKYNSIMTMFFNRLGDIFLIIVVSKFLINYTDLYFFLENLNIITVSFILACALTKSAQIPFSAWLPAAMSAPTPISAMVHSSTLVTAGVFLLHKLIFFLESAGLILFLLFLSLTTFLLGGFMANFELDFKKIVAFSTMSQISMIMFFCASSLVSIGLIHMLFHAFFKTILFCCSGLLFMSLYGDQALYSSKSNLSKIFLSSLLFLSIYSMSGLFFSSSFFTKDLIMEYLMNFSSLLLIILMLGSIFTLLYSMKLMVNSFSKFNNYSYNSEKNFFFMFFMVFSFISLYSVFMVKSFIFLDMVCVLSLSDAFFMMSILISAIFFNFLNFKESNKIFSLVFDIFFMKTLFYSILKKVEKKSLMMYVSFSDHFFFKPIYFNNLKFFLFNVEKYLNFYSFFLLMSVITY